MHRTILPLISLLLAFSCTAQKAINIHSLTLGDGHTLVLLDSAQASRVLLQDATDRFFERVTASEMSIQMKQPLAGRSRAELLPAYRDYLRRDVASFAPEESVMAAGVMQEIFNTCREVASDIFPDTLILIKTKGGHYGKSVYYTRENTIVIPSDMLGMDMREAFFNTMFHELFHVYSRLNPAKRARLYRLIGFEHIGLDRLQLPDSLAVRVLYNPDGVDFAQKISLKQANGQSIDAIPVLYSNHLGYKPGKRTFFAYVEFNLYQIEPAENGYWRVLTGPDGYSSTLNLRELPDFFQQIKDNTGYIIHPDEVLADNFSFLMQDKRNPAFTAEFSEEGKKLLADIEAVLKD